MSADTATALASLTLYVHFGVIAFNLGALVLIPLGKFFGWRFVRVFWWRALHVLSMLLVAAQAALGQYCFLTLIENHFRYYSGYYLPPAAFDRWVSAAVFWPLPAYAFVPLYLIALGLTIWFWIWARPGAAAGDKASVKP